MFDNPLNAFLLGPILYLLYRAVFPSWPECKARLPSSHTDGDYNWAPAAHPPVICARKFTVHDLEPYNGKNVAEKDGGRILLAIARLNKDGSLKERTVFDVTNGRNFYGPGEAARRDGTDGRRHVW
jgi:membrane-associated progesterone receptor component